MSCPHPTAQYGHTPSVTVAPRRRDDFAAVCGLNGCGLDATGRLNIGVPFEREWLSDRKRKSSARIDRGHAARPEADAVGPGVDVEPVRPDEADHGQSVPARQIDSETR